MDNDQILTLKAAEPLNLSPPFEAVPWARFAYGLLGPDDAIQVPNRPPKVGETIAVIHEQTNAAGHRELTISRAVTESIYSNHITARMIL